MIKLSLKKSNSHWKEMGDGVKFLLNYPNIEQDQHLQSILMSDKYSGGDKMLKYAQHLIKYTVKDWEGIPEKCVIKNDELEDSLWWGLVNDPKQALELFALIQPEVEVTNEDKKKLTSELTSTTKGSSVENAKSIP